MDYNVCVIGQMGVSYVICVCHEDMTLNVYDK